MTNTISNFTLYAFVALGGACGASLRFYISQLVLNWLGKGFPFATLMVNITGSFIMGLLYQLIEHQILDINIHRTLSLGATSNKMKVLIAGEKCTILRVA